MKNVANREHKIFAKMSISPVAVRLAIERSNSA